MKILCTPKLRFRVRRFLIHARWDFTAHIPLAISGRFRASDAGRSGGTLTETRGKFFFPSTLFACFSTVYVFESLKISTFSKNAVFDARNFLLRVENFRDFGGLFPSFPGSVR